MRIFVLSALSANPIAASNSVGKPAPRADSQDSKQPANGSPFAVLLAATAPAKPQDNDVKPVTPHDSDTSSPTGKAKTADVRRDLAKSGNAKTPDAKKSSNSAKSGNSVKTTDVARSKNAHKSSDTSKTADTAKSGNTPAQISAASSEQTTPKDHDGKEQAGSPAEKGDAAANDNHQGDAQAIQTADASQPAAQPDPKALAQAQSQLASQLQAPPQPPSNSAPANDDASDEPQVAAAPAISGNPPAPAAATTPAPAQAGTALPGDTSLPAMPNAAPRDAAPASRTKQALQAATDQTATNKPAAASQSVPADPVNANKAPVQTAGDAIKNAGDGKTAAVSSEADKSGPQIANLDAAPQPQQTSQPAPAPQQPAPGAPNLTAISASVPAMPVQAMNTVAPDGSVHLSAPASDAAPDVNGLAVEIAARSQNGAKEFAIRLDPPELGRVEVRLSIDASGKAEAHMTVDQPNTLNLLQKDSTTLTQALRDAGLDVSHDGLNFSLRGQGGQHGQNGENGQDRVPRNNLTASRVIDSVLSASATSFTGGGDGRLDIHV